MDNQSLDDHIVDQLYKLGKEDGKDFVLKHYKETEKYFDVKGKIYVQGFVDGMEETYKQLQEQEKLQEETSKLK